MVLKLAQKMYTKHATFINKVVKFGLVGVLNTGVDFGVYFLLTQNIIGLSLSYYVGHIAGFSIASANSFFLNKYWTFNNKEKKWVKQYAQFIILQSIGLFISTTIFSLLIEGMQLYDVYAKLIATLVVFVWNFLLSRHIVFKT